ncbi:MAG: lipopolysaccharide kinase InaA family protein [Candidatus Neomarinimicrobiota bacterium]
MTHFGSSVSIYGDLPEPLTMSDFSNRDSILSKAEQVYKTSPNLVARLDSTEGPIVIKWFGWRHSVHYYLSPTFPSRAYASWSVAHALKRAGARTPEPLYVYTRRHMGFIKENFSVTEAIYPHTRLRPLLLSNASETLFSTAIEDLARSLAKMHRRGILHRDLTTANFLVNDAGKVFIIDLNRARQLSELSTHHRLTDLAKLTFKTAETNLTEELTRLFFDTYTAESKTLPNLIRPYRNYRERLLRRRRLKKKLRQLSHSK